MRNAKSFRREIKKIQKSAQTVEQIICDFILKKIVKNEKIFKNRLDFLEKV